MIRPDNRNFYYRGDCENHAHKVCDDCIYGENVRVNDCSRFITKNCLECECHYCRSVEDNRVNNKVKD